jgi:hypothetical protein
MRDWSDLRASAEAAAAQLASGPREWPGRPSRQRLEFFLAASPEVILMLLDEHAELMTRAERTGLTW